MAVGLVLTGHFANLIIFTSLIIIHETGHVIMATLMRYKLDKVIIYPYGGFTKLDTIVNTNIYKDLLVAISGVVMQSICFIIIFFLYQKGIIREYIYNLFFLYHRSMLLFNLLPIIPLDGSKVVNLFLCKYFNFNLSNNFTVLISFVTIIFILISGLYESNYSFLMVIMVLMQNIYNFYKDIAYVYNRFLLERYLYDIKFKDKKIIDDKNKMYKNKTHLFKISGNIIPERIYLSSFFKKKSWFVWLSVNFMINYYCFEDL